MKKFVSGFLAGILVMIGSIALAQGLEKKEATVRPDFKVTLDGEVAQLEKPPIVVEGSMYLPVKATAELAGLEVNWNQETLTAELETKPSPNQVINDLETLTIEMLNEKVTGTAKTITIDNGTEAGYKWEIDFFDFEFNEPTSEQKYYYDDVQKILNFTIKVDVPDDHKIRFLVDLFGYLNNDPDYLNSTDAKSPSFQFRVPLKGIKTVDDKFLNNGINYFRFGVLVRTTEMPTKLMIRTKNNIDYELLEWTIH